MSGAADDWAVALEQIASAFELPLHAVQADASALGQTIFSCQAPFAVTTVQPTWDLDYAQHYLWALLDGMPSLGRPTAPSPC